MEGLQEGRNAAAMCSAFLQFSDPAFLQFCNPSFLQCL